MYAYNTRMFEQAGIAKLPETWDELIAVAEKLTKPEQGVYGLALSYGDKFANTPMKVVTMFNAQLGGRWLSPDNKQLLLTSPQVLEAFHSYFDFITRYKILAPEAVTWTRSDALAAFASEKAAISIMVLPTGDPGLRGTPVDGHYAYAPMPLVPPGHATRPEGGVPFGSLIGGDNIAVPNWSKDKDLAWKYVALRTSPKWQFEYYKLGNELPIRNEVKDQIIALDPKAEVYYQAVAESKLIMFHPIWPEIDFLIADLAGRAAPQLLAGTFRNEQIDQGLAAALPELQASLARHNAGAN
jgi:multiple sugar transport system substrate-binding protein